MRRKLLIATIVVGVALIPLGVGWIVYSMQKTGHYDPNAEVTDQDTHLTSHGAYVSDSAWPVVGFGLTFAGGILLSVGIFGMAFGSFFGGDDDSPSPESILAHATPTTSMGWGPGGATQYPPGGPPGGG